jgi:opacity protein-like surface antigen
LQGRAGVQLAQYMQSGSGTQTSFSVGGGVNWLMNRNMRLSADYDFTTQTSGSNTTFNGQPNLTTINTGAYNRNLVLVALHFGL